MYDPMDDFFDEHPAITAASEWAVRDSTVDWTRLARAGDAVVGGMQRLNQSRRHALRARMLAAAGQTEPATDSDDDAGGGDDAPAPGLLQDIRDVFEAVGDLPASVHAFLAYLSEDPDGVAALRAWGRGVGFSGAEVSWLLADVAKLDHDPIAAIKAAGGLDPLFAHVYMGPDIVRAGFLFVDGPEVPPHLQTFVSALAQRGVTASLFHVLPAVAGLTWLAGTRSDASPQNEVHIATLEAMLGARTACFDQKRCRGTVIARNVTVQTCKRRNGLSLYTGTRCVTF
jgi:hypothetical protein